MYRKINFRFDFFLAYFFNSQGNFTCQIYKNRTIVGKAKGFRVCSVQRIIIFTVIVIINYEHLLVAPVSFNRTKHLYC